MKTERPLEAFEKVIVNLPVIALEGEGVGFDLKEWDGVLYRPLRQMEKRFRKIRFRAVPYFSWANRDAGAMTVWLMRL